MPSDSFTVALLIKKINIGGAQMSAIFDLLSLSTYLLYFFVHSARDQKNTTWTGNQSKSKSYLKLYLKLYLSPVCSRTRTRTPALIGIQSGVAATRCDIIAIT